MLLSFIHISLLDMLDIFLVALLLFQLYRLIKGTIAINIFVGIFGVYLFWLLVKALNMELLSSILGQFIGVGVIALIIVFQQELRRFLLILGGRYKIPGWLSFSFLFAQETSELISNEIMSVVEACENMSSTKTGALIVFARKSELDQILETGDQIDAQISSRLLESIFFKNSPLHDGAVLIVRDKIRAARCQLPTTENIYLPAKYGMRHRAAVGMTEKTDSVVAIVSEETGNISISVDGKLSGKLTPSELQKQLMKELG